MRILFSPFSVPKPVFWLIMALILCFMLLIQWDWMRAGGPQIEVAVRQEVASLSRSDESLHSLKLGRGSTMRIVGSGASMTGYCQFDGDYSNQTWDVIVRWRKADTNALIDKIELHCTSQEPKIIWSRK